MHTLHVQIEEPCVWVLVPDQKRRRRMEDEEASLPPVQFSSYRPTAAEDTAPAAISFLLRCWEVNILKNWPKTWFQYYCISATNKQRLVLCPMPKERETPLSTATVNKPSSLSLAALLPISRPVGDDIDCSLMQDSVIFSPAWIWRCVKRLCT